MRLLLTVGGRVAYWLGWPVWRFLLAHSVRTRVLVLSDGAVLVVASYLGDGSWSLPGGGLHRAEDPADGAARELYEETGLRVAATSLKNMGVHRVTRRGLSYPAHFFAVEVPRQPMQVQRFEVANYRWVPLAEIETFTDNPTVLTGLRLWRAQSGYNSTKADA